MVAWKKVLCGAGIAAACVISQARATYPPLQPGYGYPGTSPAWCPVPGWYPGTTPGGYPGMVPGWYPPAGGYAPGVNPYLASPPAGYPHPWTPAAPGMTPSQASPEMSRPTPSRPMPSRPTPPDTSRPMPPDTSRPTPPNTSRPTPPDTTRPTPPSSSGDTPRTDRTPGSTTTPGAGTTPGSGSTPNASGTGGDTGANANSAQSGNTADNSGQGNNSAVNAPSDSAVGGGGGEGGSSGLASASPNMFGDAFGGGTLKYVASVDRLAIQRTAVVLPSNPGVLFTVYSPFRIFSGPRSVQDTLAGWRSSGNSRLPGTVVGTVSTYPNLVSLLPNDQVTAGLATNRETYIFPVKPTTDPLQGQLSTTLHNLFRTRTGLDGIVGFNQAASGAFASSLPPYVTDPANYREFGIFYDYGAAFQLPSPSAGGVVGRTKVADDNSPLPRDRIIFNYDYFNHVAITGQGADVHRFSVGFEKTILDSQRASIEVRLPFAGTLDADVVADGRVGTRAAELGDLHLTLKCLVYGGETTYFTIGSGLAIPTAGDIRITLPDGTEILRAHNDTVLIEPYAAVLWTPTWRLFAQAWTQFVLNANSNRVEANLTGSGLTKIGGLYDQTAVLTSAQIGYWLYRNNNVATLSALAPFAEVHYNASLGGATAVQAGIFQVGEERRLKEINATFGFAAVIGDNFQLMVGASVPLLSGDTHRTFDYQLGIRGNLFFGPTAAARSGLWPTSF